MYMYVYIDEFCMHVSLIGARTHSPPRSIIGYQHFFRRALYVLGLSCGSTTGSSSVGRIASITGGGGGGGGGGGPRCRRRAPLPLFRLISIFDRLTQLELLVGDVSPSGLSREREKIEEGRSDLRFLKRINRVGEDNFEMYLRYR